MKFNWNGDEWVQGQRVDAVSGKLVTFVVLLGMFDLCMSWWLWGAQWLTASFHFLGL